MPSALHSFVFDTNFGFGEESVFSPRVSEEVYVPPPTGGNFLQLDNTPFLQLDNTPLLLL